MKLKTKNKKSKQSLKKSRKPNIILVAEVPGDFGAYGNRYLPVS
jgi:hypothetical protein